MYHLNSIKLEAEQYPTREHYPFNLPLFAETKKLDFTNPVTLFVGQNGSGKSTLFEAIAVAAGIYIWRNNMTSRYMVNRYEATLHRSLKVSWATTDPGQLEFFGGKSLISQSHGQSLMSFFRSRYKLKGLYLLDEPETALSPSSQLELLRLISENSKGGHAQFIVATHSPILLACKNATIYNFDEMPVSEVKYEDTEHFRVYRDFLNHREKYLMD